MKVTKVSFRAAKERDITTLMKHMKDFHEFDHVEPFDDESAQAAMKKVVCDRTLGRVWLIEHSQETVVVGYIVMTLAYRLEYRGYYAFLDELFICDRWRNQGIGTSALAFLTRACTELGVRKLQLEVKVDNPAATALYKKAGFIKQERNLFLQDFG